MKKNIKFKIAFTIVFLLFFAFYMGAYSDIALSDLSEFINSESHFLEYKNMKVHYRDEGQGEAIVLIHGTGASLHTWDYWVNGLKNNYRVIRLDLPGFGLTGPHSERNYSIEEYVNTVDALLEYLEIKSCVIVGNSLGGGISWNYVVKHSDKVQKLVLIDSSSFKIGDGIGIFSIAQNPITAFIGKRFTPKFLIKMSLKQVYFDDNKVDSDLVNYYHKMLLRAGNRQAMIDRISQINEYDTEKLKNIEIPVLIMWGAADKWIPLEVGYRLKNILKKSKLVVYQNAGHVPMEEIPSETLQTFIEFIDKN